MTLSRPGEIHHLICGRIGHRQQRQLATLRVQQADGARFVGITGVAAANVVWRGVTRRQVVGKRDAFHVSAVNVMHRHVPSIRRPFVGWPSPDTRADLAVGTLVSACLQVRNGSDADLGGSERLARASIEHPEVAVLEPADALPPRRHRQIGCAGLAIDEGTLDSPECVQP